MRISDWSSDVCSSDLGTTIHLHCDLTFATPESSFRTPFVDLGLVPEAGSSLLAPAIMGRQQAFALLAMGEAFPAERAKAAGLIYEVVEASKLEETVLAAAEAIAAKPPEALRIARDLMRAPRDAVVARIEEEGARSEEHTSELQSLMRISYAV